MRQNEEKVEGREESRGLLAVQGAASRAVNSNPDRYHTMLLP